MHVEDYMAIMEEELEMHENKLFEGISLTKGLIRKTHNFEEKIYAMEQILVHLTHSKIDEYPKLRGYLRKISLEYNKLQESLGKLSDEELHFVKEEKTRLANIKKIRHSSWKLAEKAIKGEIKDLRADIRLLKATLKHFTRLIKALEDEEHVIIKEERVDKLRHEGKILKELEDEEFYINSLYRFIKFYKPVFEDMVKKEEQLMEKEKAIKKKLKKR